MLDTGLALMPGAFSTAISMLIIGRILNRVDGRFSIVFGTLLFAWSSWMLGGLSVRRATGTSSLAASDPGLRFGLPFRAADDDLARRRPGS